MGRQISYPVIDPERTGKQLKKLLEEMGLLLGRHMEELVVPGDGEEGVRFFGKNRRRMLSYWEKIEAA